MHICKLINVKLPVNHICGFAIIKKKQTTHTLHDLALNTTVLKHTKPYSNTLCPD